MSAKVQKAILAALSGPLHKSTPAAVNSLGRAADDAERAQIKSCIIRKAKQFGWVGSLPQNWQDELKGKSSG